MLRLLLWFCFFIVCLFVSLLGFTDMFIFIKQKNKNSHVITSILKDKELAHSCECNKYYALKILLNRVLRTYFLFQS